MIDKGKLLAALMRLALCVMCVAPTSTIASPQGLLPRLHYRRFLPRRYRRRPGRHPCENETEESDL